MAFTELSTCIVANQKILTFLFLLLLFQFRVLFCNICKVLRLQFTFELKIIVIFTIHQISIFWFNRISSQFFSLASFLWLQSKWVLSRAFGNPRLLYMQISFQKQIVIIQQSRSSRAIKIIQDLAPESGILLRELFARRSQNLVLGNFFEQIYQVG